MPYDGVLNWLEEQGRKLIGAGSPQDQIVASLVLGVLLIGTSAIGLVFTVALLPIPTVAFVLGVLRLSSTVDSWYPV